MIVCVATAVVCDSVVVHVDVVCCNCLLCCCIRLLLRVLDYVRVIGVVVVMMCCVRCGVGDYVVDMRMCICEVNDDRVIGVATYVVDYVDVVDACVVVFCMYAGVVGCVCVMLLFRIVSPLLMLTMLTVYMLFHIAVVLRFIFVLFCVLSFVFTFRYVTLWCCYCMQCGVHYTM